MKVMLTMYYDEQNSETTRVVYDPAWLEANIFLQAATLGDALDVVGAAWLIAERAAVEAEQIPGKES
jgi:hypothetical protein